MFMWREKGRRDLTLARFANQSPIRDLFDTVYTSVVLVLIPALTTPDYTFTEADFAKRPEFYSEDPLAMPENVNDFEVEVRGRLSPEFGDQEKWNQIGNVLTDRLLVILNSRGLIVKGWTASAALRLQPGYYGDMIAAQERANKAATDDDFARMRTDPHV